MTIIYDGSYMAMSIRTAFAKSPAPLRTNLRPAHRLLLHTVALATPLPRLRRIESVNTAQRLSSVAFNLATIAALLLPGCSHSSPPRAATHPASGSITYQGQPISGAFLALHPKTSVAPEVPTATATVKPDGTFAVSTYDANDGLPEGDYVVTVQWRKAVKSGGDYLPGPNLLPAKYSRPESSDVVVHIAAGQNDLPHIALKR